MKRIWNKLFGRTTATTDASFAEKSRDEADILRQQAERQRLQDELGLRTTRNGSWFGN
jgi:hypothetical protein